MRTISFPRFCGLLGSVYLCKDDTGFVRVWGHLIDPAERTLTFWRHKADEAYQFKHLDTYVIKTSLAAKEDEKVARGYAAADLDRREHDGLLREIHAAYLEAVAEDNFHYTPCTARTALEVLPQR